MISRRFPRRVYSWLCFVSYFGWDYPIVYRPCEIIIALRATFLFILVHRWCQRMANSVCLPLNGGFSIKTTTYSALLQTLALRATRGANPAVHFDTNNFHLASYGCLNYLAASELRHFQLSLAPTLLFNDSGFDTTTFCLIYKCTTSCYIEPNLLVRCLLFRKTFRSYKIQH